MLISIPDCIRFGFATLHDSSEYALKWFYETGYLPLGEDTEATLLSEIMPPVGK